MNTALLVKILKIICLIIFITLVVLTFWICAIRDIFFIPVHAGFYKCDRPYIGVVTNNNEVNTTLTSKDYCVDLYIDYKNLRGNSKISPQKNEKLILDFSNLYTVSLAKKHSFFTSSSKSYDHELKNVGLFYLSYQQNWSSTQSDPKTVQPQLIINDFKLKTALF
ncbi:hypothetical protein [Acinetobacter baumannii]